MTDTWKPSEDILLEAKELIEDSSSTSLDKLYGYGTLFFCRQEPWVPSTTVQLAQGMDEFAEELIESARVICQWALGLEEGKDISDGQMTEVLIAVESRERAELIAEAIQRAGFKPDIHLNTAIKAWDTIMGADADETSPLCYLGDHRWRTYWPAPEHRHRLWWWTMENKTP